MTDIDQRHDDPRVERTRAAVIEAAADLLTCHGPAAITHASVAAAANVSRTTVYNHWPTRGDLLRATIDSVGRLKPELADLTGDVRADLGLLCRHLIDDLLDDQRAPMIATMMERALRDPVVVSVRNEFLAQFETVFRAVIDRGVADRVLRADIDVRRSMATLLGGFLFARFMSDVEFTRDDAERSLDDFVALNAPR
jgi:AcrR family transcriptional regulator